MTIKLSDIQKRFDVPTYTLRNWEKSEAASWRRKLYDHMIEIIIKEVYEKLSSQISSSKHDK